MAAVSPVMVISLEISGPRRPGEPSSPARIAASQYSHNSNTNPASIGDPEPFYLFGPTFLSNKCQLGTECHISLNSCLKQTFNILVPTSSPFLFLQAHLFLPIGAKAPLVGSDRLYQHPQAPATTNL